MHLNLGHHCYIVGICFICVAYVFIVLHVFYMFYICYMFFNPFGDSLSRFELAGK